MLEDVNRHDRLIYNDFFGIFPYHIRTQLFNKAESRVAKAGEYVMQKGGDGSWMGAVLSGRIRICLHAQDGREMIISMVEPGEIFGERAVFDGLPRSGEGIAEVDTAYMMFRREDLFPALYAYPDAMMYVIRILCNRVVRYMNTMELYAMHSLPVRLANFLVFLGHKYGKGENGRLALSLNLSQTDLSRQIASSRESINRQMKAFVQQGLIEVQDDTIILTDVAGLEKICASPEYS